MGLVYLRPAMSLLFCKCWSSPICGWQSCTLCITHQGWCLCYLFIYLFILLLLSGQTVFSSICFYEDTVFTALSTLPCVASFELEFSVFSTTSYPTFRLLFPFIGMLSTIYGKLGTWFVLNELVCAWADVEQVGFSVVHGTQSSICMFDLYQLSCSYWQHRFRNWSVSLSVLQNLGLYSVTVFFSYNIVKVRDCSYGTCNAGNTWLRLGKDWYYSK